MRTKSIDVMLSRPGVYFILSTSMRGGLVEVDTTGKCYCLSSTGEHARGEVLERGKWRPQNVFAILGPFARVRKPLTAAEHEEALYFAPPLKNLKTKYECFCAGIEAAEIAHGFHFPKEVKYDAGPRGSVARAIGDTGNNII